MACGPVRGFFFSPADIEASAALENRPLVLRVGNLPFRSAKSPKRAKEGSHGCAKVEEIFELCGLYIFKKKVHLKQLNKRCPKWCEL